MPMSKKVFIVVIVFLTVINLAATATILITRFTAEKPPRFERFDPDHPPREFFRGKLDLDNQQMEYLHQSIMDFRDSMAGPMQEHADLRHQMLTEMMSENPDQEKINQIIEEMSSLDARMRRMTVDHLLSEKTHLSPEQHRRLIGMFMRRMDNEYREHGKRRHYPDHDGRGMMRKRFDKQDTLTEENDDTTQTNNGGAL